MVCVKDTATRPRLTFVSVLPAECTSANGLMFLSCSANHDVATQRLPYGPDRLCSASQAGRVCHYHKQDAAA